MLEHTEVAKQFYKSKAWRECRESYISKVFGLCERCGNTGKIVHHKVHLNIDNINDPYITMGHDNLEYLCQTCHNREHFKKETIREGYGFDGEGNIIKIP